MEHPTYTYLVYTGQRGRPQKDVDPQLLEQAFEPGHTTNLADLARKLNMDRKTLRRILTDHDIDFKYSEITDEELDDIVRDFFAQCPDSGYQYCHGHIRSEGLRVRRVHVKASMARVRPLAALVQQGNAIVRRSYIIIRPNAVWHGDGYHKLIKYGIVIHGFVDGYCRTVCSVLLP